MRRLAPRLYLLFVSLLAVTACGQPDPVVMPVSMPECIYQGPSAMETGNARVSLTLNGITDSGVALAELTVDLTHSDLSAHLETVDTRWSERPSWVSTVLELRLDAAEGRDGVEETVALEPGRYVVVCLDYPVDDSEPTAMVAGGLEVREG